MKMTEREIRNKLIQRFRKKTTGFVTLHFDRKQRKGLRIYYSYGGHYHVKRFRGSSLTDLNLHGNFNDIYKIIVREYEDVNKTESQKAIGSMVEKVKQMSLFK